MIVAILDDNINLRITSNWKKRNKILAERLGEDGINELPNFILASGAIQLGCWHVDKVEDMTIDNIVHCNSMSIESKDILEKYLKNMESKRREILANT